VPTGHNPKASKLVGNFYDCSSKVFTNCGSCCRSNRVRLKSKSKRPRVFGLDGRSNSRKSEKVPFQWRNRIVTKWPLFRVPREASVRPSRSDLHTTALTSSSPTCFPQRILPKSFRSPGDSDPRRRAHRKDQAGCRGRRCRKEFGRALTWREP
jgi:hypothetical protein